MHVHLTKKKQRKRSATYASPIGEAILIIQKFIVMSQKDGCWHGIETIILQITYFKN